MSRSGVARKVLVDDRRKRVMCVKNMQKNMK